MIGLLKRLARDKSENSNKITKALRNGYLLLIAWSGHVFGLITGLEDNPLLKRVSNSQDSKSWVTLKLNWTNYWMRIKFELELMLRIK